MRIQYGALIPPPLEEAFAFVADPRPWPSFFAGMRSVEVGADWGAVGGHARMTNVFLGRLVSSDLEVTSWAPPRRFGYLLRQAGRPTIDNRRVLEPAPGGTAMQGSSQSALPLGPAGLLGWVQLQALRRVYAQAMRRLPEAAARRTSPPS